MKKITPGRLITAFAVIAVVAGIAALIIAAYQKGALTSEESFRKFITDFGYLGGIVFFIFQVSTVIIAPIPSNISITAGGYIYGSWISLIISYIAVIAGSMIVFALARRIGRPFAENFMNKKLSDKYLDLIETKRDPFIFLVMLLPFLPDDIICIAAGLSSIPARRFFIIILITKPWGIITAAAVGSSLISLPPWGWAIVFAVSLVVLLLGLKYGDRVERFIVDRLSRVRKDGAKSVKQA
ncbi:MAG TPA: TVP38/TMEM64 family protein [Clostridia bacterium]|nr:TVP38/TMEM64 family protein [Clostridia bacterium]